MSADNKILFNVNNSPHVKSGDTTAGIMRLVCLALTPALTFALFVFGWHALVVMVSCVLGAVAAEYVCQRWRGVPITIGDGSAVLTGLLLAAVCPANLPAWIGFVGGVFSIAIVKQAFGGLGHNFWNPALLGRAFLQASFPDRMMSSDWPFLSFAGDWLRNIGKDLSGTFAGINQKIAAGGVDALTGATTMAKMHFPQAKETAVAGQAVAQIPASLVNDYVQFVKNFLGIEGGSLGEVSSLLLLAGGIFLIVKKIIAPEIPLIYLGVVALLGWALPHPFKAGSAILYTPWFSGPWLMHLAGGGLMLGAFFMATDYVTSPLTRKGRVIFAVGCGALTMLIRLFSGYPEGVCYAILIMNTCVPLIDSLTKPRVFGKVR